jgi:hypothetical protein
MQRVWRQSTAKRSVAGPQFTQGVIDFDFSVGSNTVFIASKSYFRIATKLVDAADGTTPPPSTADVAYANFCPGNMFDNSFFYAGGQNVSSCINYGPQAHALAYRLRKSGAWMNSIGKDAYGICADFTTRSRMVRPETAEEKAESALGQTPSRDPDDTSIRYFMYQPPIGIMEHSKPMGAGSYRFQFNPASNFAKACLEQAANSADYQVQVTGMELYICEEKLDVSPSGSDVLHLLEHQVQSKKLSESGSLDFTVPPSTKAITVFVQSGLTGTNTQYPPSKFVGATDVKLNNLQLTFANTTKPPTNWLSMAGAKTEGLHQRYLDTQIESGQAFSSGGCESMADWLANGPIYHYTFVRDASDRSTQLQLSSQWSGNISASTDNIFCVAHYTRSVQIDVENGYISQVQSLNI